MDIYERITQRILSIQNNKPIIIAIDGVDTSGKTIFTKLVNEKLKQLNINVISLSIDGFHNPKNIRLQKGLLSPDGYFYDSFNIEAVKKCIVEPIKKQEGSIIHGIYDYQNDTQIEKRISPVHSDLIVLFEGIFLHRDELYPFWDLSIFLDISFETVLHRAFERDIEYFRSFEEVEKRYQQRYIPGQMIYLEKCSPKKRAAIVIDNNDFLNPQVLKWS